MMWQFLLLETLCLFLERAPLRKSSLFRRVFFSVRVLFSGKVLETSLSKIFWCNLQCCFFGGAIGRCVFISVSAQSSFPEDGFLAWFGPFESLLWSLFFLGPVGTEASHSKQLQRATFQH